MFSTEVLCLFKFATFMCGQPSTVFPVVTFRYVSEDGLFVGLSSCVVSLLSISSIPVLLFIISFPSAWLGFILFFNLCVCVCVSFRETEREREYVGGRAEGERESQGGSLPSAEPTRCGARTHGPEIAT